jgi:hypothetical protein
MTMMTETHRLEREIAAEQAALGENLHELEVRMRAAADWREQVQRRPWVMVGLAFGGGVALSALAGSRPRRRRRVRRVQPAGDSSREDAQPADRNDPWHRFKGALFAAAAVEAANLVAKVLPSFRDEFET